MQGGLFGYISGIDDSIITINNCLNEKSNGGLINSLVLIAFSCMSCISLISKTPRNIDPNPILSTQLDENPVVSSTVMKIRNSADTVEKVLGDIEIFRCNTKDEAQQQYDSHKATFMEGGSACRMYRERNTNGNMYYAAYKRIRFDYNHGIPYRVINHPDIWIGFLNGNYFILFRTCPIVKRITEAMIIRRHLMMTLSM